MGNTAGQAVYRVRKAYRKENRPPKYRYTLELIDDRTQQVMAACDLAGKAVFSTLAITDHERRTWQVRPNRKIMPSQWTVTDPGGKTAMRLDQKMLGKAVNPLYKTVLALLDDAGNEAYRLVDPRTNIPDRILGVGSTEWALMEGDTPVAKLTRLKEEKEPSEGFFGKLKKMLSTSDRGVVSAGNRHVLPAPVALAMLLIFDELTDV